MFKAKIHVTLRKSVLDPQGKTVLHALESMGFKDAKDLRVGKYFELTVDASNQGDAQKKVKDICDKVLINPVIEDYAFELQEAGSAK